MRDWIDVTGWTLLHFAWQGALLGLAVAGVLWLCRRRSAGARYAVASGGLAALLAAPVVTAAVLWQAARSAEPRRLPDRAAARALEDGSPGGHALAAPAAPDTVRARLAAALPAVVAVWLAGVSLLLVRTGGGLWQVRRLHEAGLAAPASRWQEAAARLASRLGLPEAVRVVESRLVGAPTVVGWMRPIILLPVAALANLTPAQVEAILAHELAHVRRRDQFVNLLQSLAETLLFHHPAVWWVSGRIRAEREHCRDDAALAASGDRAGYAAALAALEEWRGRGTAPVLGAADGPLGGRARRVLDRPPPGRPRAAGRVAAWALAAALCAGIGAAAWPLGGGMSGAARTAGTESAAPPAARPAAQAGWRTAETPPNASEDRYRPHGAAQADRRTAETPHFDVRYGAALAGDVERVEAARSGRAPAVACTKPVHGVQRTPSICRDGQSRMGAPRSGP